MLPPYKTNKTRAGIKIQRSAKVLPTFGLRQLLSLALSFVSVMCVPPRPLDLRRALSKNFLANKLSAKLEASCKVAKLQLRVAAIALWLS